RCRLAGGLRCRLAGGASGRCLRDRLRRGCGLLRGCSHRRAQPVEVLDQCAVALCRVSAQPAECRGHVLVSGVGAPAEVVAHRRKRLACLIECLLETSSCLLDFPAGRGAGCLGPGCARAPARATRGPAGCRLLRGWHGRTPFSLCRVETVVGQTYALLTV